MIFQEVGKCQKRHKNSPKPPFFGRFRAFGAEDEIRTRAAVSSTTPLAGA